MTFRAINWTQSELIGERKMDAMTDNAEWLYANTPRAVYTVSSLKRQEGVKIASGRVMFQPQASPTAWADVYFGNFFTSNCQPNITTGVVSSSQSQIFCNISGQGSLLSPTSAGFRAHVTVDAAKPANAKISRMIYVTWIAMGY